MTTFNGHPRTYSHRHRRREERIRAREEAILRTSRELIRSHGYLGLTMDRIAEGVGISKPTVYGHFSSKEAVVLGMAIENLFHRNRLNALAASIEGTTRERMVAIGYVAEQILPEHLEVELILYANSIREKTSKDLQLMLLEAETRCLAILKEVVCEAIEAGDLNLAKPNNPESLVYALWSVYFGGCVIHNSGLPFDKIDHFQLRDLLSAVSWGGLYMLDGVGWRPLSSEWDYRKTTERAKKILDPEIAEALAQKKPREVAKRQSGAKRRSPEAIRS